jgi:hypothetical protein
VASTANPFTQVRDLRDLRALETVADRGSAPLLATVCAEAFETAARTA